MALSSALSGLLTPSRWSGSSWMALSALAFSVMTLLAKVVAPRIPGAEIILARTLVTLVATAALLRLRRVRPMLGRHRRLLVLRGIAGFVALDCLFYALARLPLAEATLFQYLNPVLVTLLAAVVLREPVTRRALAALGLCVAGLVLVARPAVLFGGLAPALDPTAVGVAVLGALFSSVAYLTIRVIGPREDPLVVVFYLPLMSLPVSLAVSATDFVVPSASDAAVLLGIGLLTQVGQVALTNGLQREAAGRATTVGYLQIAFAALWGWLFFGELPDAWSLGGAALLVAGVLTAARFRVQRATEAVVVPGADLVPASTAEDAPASRPPPAG